VTPTITPTPTPQVGPGGLVFYAVTPCRIVDTRNPDGPFGGPALVANAGRTFVVGGQCAIPTNAVTAAVNVTVTQPGAGGDLRIYPAGAALPSTSTINFGPGQTRANNALVALGTGGGITVHNDATATVHFILDVNGYFR
jgi:hypothetical protein